MNICTYLRHIVSGGEVRFMYCKVSTLKEYEMPQTKKQVWAFLGPMDIIDGFFPFFTTLACPLTELTKKNKENVVKWTEACHCAFNSLKESLNCKPVLTTPDWARKFILQTDSSATGLGYMISQKNENSDEHAIVYGSKKLLPRE